MQPLFYCALHQQSLLYFHQHAFVLKQRRRHSLFLTIWGGWPRQAAGRQKTFWNSDPHSGLTWPDGLRPGEQASGCGGHGWFQLTFLPSHPSLAFSFDLRPLPASYFFFLHCLSSGMDSFIPFIQQLRSASFLPSSRRGFFAPSSKLLKLSLDVSFCAFPFLFRAPFASFLLFPVSPLYILFPKTHSFHPFCALYGGIVMIPTGRNRREQASIPAGLANSGRQAGSGIQ